MYTYIILGSVCLCGVLYNFNNIQANNASLPNNQSDIMNILRKALRSQLAGKSGPDIVKSDSLREGDDCQWEGVIGTCVKETRCLSTLDKSGPKHFVCSESGQERVVCCTDCNFVNSTRDAVVVPTGGVFWKIGNKVRDHCLQYIHDLPYQCKQNWHPGEINKTLDEDKNCYRLETEAKTGSPRETRVAHYPHQALLGFQRETSETVVWETGGSIISDTYILTSVWSLYLYSGPTFVALNVTSSGNSSNWQIHKVKRIIRHPDYNPYLYYNDIALIEVETPIQFDKNVLPACLLAEEISLEDAVATTQRDITAKKFKYSKTLQTIQLETATDEECRTEIPRCNGYNSTLHMCYHSKTNPAMACMGTFGEPVLVDNQYSSCVHTIVGLTWYCGWFICNIRNGLVPYTRLSYYVPWIESIVWP